MKGSLKHSIKKHVSSSLPLTLAVLTAIIATLALVYLTPLRHIAILPATMNEMDPKAFYDARAKNPDGYILIDVRSANIYQSAHAEGAINIPIENFYDDRESLPRSGKKIALICTTGRLAAVAYGYLEDQGFTNLIHIEGGMVNWASEGLPVQGTNIGLAGSTSVTDQHQ